MISVVTPSLSATDAKPIIRYFMPATPLDKLSFSYISSGVYASLSQDKVTQRNEAIELEIPSYPFEVKAVADSNGKQACSPDTPYLQPDGSCGSILQCDAKCAQCPDGPSLCSVCSLDYPIDTLDVNAAAGGDRGDCSADCAAGSNTYFDGVRSCKACGGADITGLR